MKKIIAFDLSSGDSDIIESYEAALNFCKINNDWKILAFVHENEINKLPKNSPKNLEIFTCKQIIQQDDGVMEIKRKSDSTLIKAISIVKENKASGIVSASASGPLVAAGYLTFRSINNIKPSFAPIIFSKDGELRTMIDVGANIGATSQVLNQYAIMGSIFAKELGFSEKPIVMQLNIGKEEKKGTTLQRETFKLLNENELINFHGNIEPNEILSKKNVHVIITDAYSGNIALKSYEGAIEIFKSLIKESVSNSKKDKMGFFLAKNFRKKIKIINNDDTGGAIVLGLNNLLIKAHGSSNSKQLFSSLNDAKKLIEANLIKKIKVAIEDYENRN